MSQPAYAIQPQRNPCPPTHMSSIISFFAFSGGVGASSSTSTKPQSIGSDAENKETKATAGMTSQSKTPDLLKPNSGSVPGTDVAKLRASTIQYFAQVTTVVRPQGNSAPDAQATETETNSSRWPRASQAYCIYSRKKGDLDVTGVMTIGLSNPYQTTFYFAIGIGIEILLEAPTAQSRLAGKDGVITGTSISQSWMFAIIHEIAHQCFTLGLQIRQLLEKLQLLSVEIAGIPLPLDYLDPETGRCCVLLGHLGDPDVPRGFNVTVPHQQQWILQSVLFVPARLLTFAECQLIRKEGSEARRKLGELFVKTKEFSLCNVPNHLWPKEKELTLTATTSSKTGDTPTATSSSCSSAAATATAAQGGASAKRELSVPTTCSSSLSDTRLRTS